MRARRGAVLIGVVLVVSVAAILWIQGNFPRLTGASSTGVSLEKDGVECAPVPETGEARQSVEAIALPPVEEVSSAAEALEAAEWEKHLKGVRQTDLEEAAKWDLTEDQIEASSTDGLLMHVVKTPLNRTFWIYSDPNLGIDRALRASKTFQAFVDRPDKVNAVGALYAELASAPSESSLRDHTMETMRRAESYAPWLKDLNQKQDPEKQIIAACSLALAQIDEVMMYPDIFASINGHEAELLLQALVDRHHRIEKMRDTYGDDAYNFASGEGMRLCRSLARQWNEKLYAKLSTIKVTEYEQEPHFYQVIQEHLNENKPATQ